jgi:hypothetical protein
MPQKFQRPVEFLVNNTQPAIKFETVDELKEWATRERDYWAKFAEKVTSASAWPQYASPGLLTELYGYLIDKIREAEQKRITWPEAEDQIRQNLNHRSQNLHTVISSSPEANFLAKVLESDPRRAIYAYFGISPSYPSDVLREAVNNQHSFRRLVAGIADAHLIRVGIDPTVAQGAKDALDKLVQSLASLETRSREQVQQFSEDAKTVLENTLGTERQLKKSVGDAIGEAQASLKSTIAELKQGLDEFDQEVRHKLAYEAPASYWSKKADRHRSKARASSSLYYFSLIASVGGWGFLAFMLSGSAELRNLIFDSQGAFTLKPLVVLGFPAILIIWLLRYFSRRALEERTLYEDASERKTIAQTLLALDDKGKGTPEQRLLMVQALTRQSRLTAADDTTPTTLLDHVLQGSQKSEGKR